MDLAILVGVTALFTLMNAFYVLAEFASVRARHTRVEQLAEAGHAGARRLAPVLESPARLDRYVATCQIGITLATLVLGFYGQQALAPRLAAWLGAWLGAITAATVATLGALLVMTVVQIVLGELVPKAIAVRYPERSALAAAPLMDLSERALRPIVALFNGAANALLRTLRLPQPQGHTHVHSPEEIELLVAESGRGGALDPIERQMLHNAFDLTQLVARQVMIPRTRVVLADVRQPVDRMIEQLARSPHSRIPVHRGNPDDILGIVHLKDVYRIWRSGDGRVEDVVRPVPFVPETMPVGDLWQVLSQPQVYLAVVLDEYGGTAGIVTHEDLLEEIVGEVQDEFDAEVDSIQRLAGGAALLRGDVQVEAANEALELDLPTGQADTVGGLVMDLLGRSAEPGDEVLTRGHRLLVTAVRRRWVEQVRIEPAGSGDHTAGEPGGEEIGDRDGGAAGEGEPGPGPDPLRAVGDG
jgi:CBS domain containing-hemolysin-like protein